MSTQDILKERFPKAALDNPAMLMLFDIARMRLENNINLPGYQAPESELSVQNIKTNIANIDPIDIVQMEVRLPSVPPVLSELHSVISRRHSTADHVAKVILKDTGLSVWLLRLVNSPFFGFAVKVETVSRAVALVGIKQIQSLAIGGALNGLAARLRPDVLDIRSFWRHSMSVGVCAQEIWRITGRAEPERLFVAGMLHDVGHLLLATTAPETFKSVSYTTRSRKGYSWEVENELLGFDHARLGGMLLHRWNMPLPLIMSALRHHSAEGMDRYNEAAVIHIADIITKGLGASTHFADPVPHLLPEAWEISSLSPEMLPSIIEAMQVKIEGLSKVGLA
ncbi:HDOD domain-containing protein [Desulfovibrio litoralis]|nr:HDOD domain-containing protein [Desulfovibrio litoralis]